MPKRSRMNSPRGPDRRDASASSIEVQLSRGDVGRVINGRYRVLKLLGEGGMGVVYKALDMQVDREVAIKLMRRECLSDKKFITRFRRELEVTSHTLVDKQTVLESLARTNRVVVAEEGWPTSSIASEIIAICMEEGFDHLDAPVLRVCDEDVPLPYAANLEKLALIDADRIVNAVRKVCYKA